MEVSLDTYVQKSSDEYEQWRRRQPKVWESRAVAEEQACEIIRDMREMGAARTRQALLDRGFWHPPLLDVEGMPLDPCVMALISEHGRTERRKLAAKLL